MLDRLKRLEQKGLSYAEIRRSLVVHARELDVHAPSYEHVRRLVKESREARELRSGVLPIAVGVALGTHHGNELVRALNEDPHPERSYGRDA